MNIITIHEETEEEAGRRITEWESSSLKHKGRYGKLSWQEYLKKVGERVSEESKHECEIIVKTGSKGEQQAALRYVSFVPLVETHEEVCNRMRKDFFSHKLPAKEVKEVEEKKDYIREIIDFQRSQA